MTKPKKTSSRMPRLTVTIPEGMRDYFDELAAEEDRSVSWVIRKLGTEHYREHYEGDPPWEAA